MQLRDRKEYTSDVLQNPKKSELTKYHKKCFTGKDIHRYMVQYNDRYCYFNEEAKRGGCWDENIHTLKNKILIRQIGAYPIAGIDTLGYAVLNSAFMISSKGINPNFLLSQINSKLTQFYWLNKFADKRKDFPKIKGGYLELLPVIKTNSEITFSTLIDLLIFNLNDEETENSFAANLFENILNGCIYELYFSEEMKKAGVDILALVEKDLEAVKKLSPEKAIPKLYEKWQEPKNEVRNRLLLMSTRCPDTIGVIEASVS
jgi:hypothetical protein